MKKLVVGSALCGLMLAGSMAFAQNEVVELTEQQILLNNQAVEAREAGDFDKAEKLFTAINSLGEIDFIWMQMGKIFEAQGKCILAKDAYRRVADAPTTEDLPHEAVMQKLESMKEAYRQHCSAKIVFECASPDLQLTIDKDKTIACSSDAIEVTPGTHSVIANAPYGTNAFQMTASDGMTNNVRAEVVNYEKIANDAGVTLEEVNRKSKTFKIAGWSLIGGGVALAAAGGALYGVAHNNFKDYADKNREDPVKYNQFDQKQNETNTKYYIAYGLIGVGAAAAIGGATLLILDAVKYEKLKETLANNNMTIVPFFGVDNAGIGLTYTF